MKEGYRNVVPRLQSIDACHLMIVLEDSMEQLQVLGGITGKMMGQQVNMSQLVGDDIGDIISSQRNIEKKFDELVSLKNKLKNNPSVDDPDGDAQALENLDRQIETLQRDLHNSTNLLCHNLKQNPSAAENLLKIQNERSSLHRLLAQTCSELENSSFESLVSFVDDEKERKISLRQTILKEKEANAAVKRLAKEVTEEKKQKEQDKIARTEMISHLKDQLQEIKAKTAMESRYMAKEALVQVSASQRRFDEAQQKLVEELDALHAKLALERSVTTDIETYLKSYQDQLDTKIQLWMTKYDEDLESKHHELEQLKSARAADLSRLQEMTDLYNDMERIVTEDVRKKEQLRIEMQLKQKQMKSAIMVQSWWRGVRARQEMLRLKNKPKPKKAGKGKKG